MPTRVAGDLTAAASGRGLLQVVLISDQILMSIIPPLE
jgi:hypothetical protein